MRESVLHEKKGFGIWIVIGFIFFGAFMGGFTALSRQYVCNVNMETIAKQSDQLDFSDGVLTMVDNDTQIYFESDKDIFINYIVISVKKLSKPTVNVRLCYADNENDFSETKAVNFYLKEGFNEIRTSIGKKKYFRLDIFGGGG